jgi:glycosyltransferase involved in cell wall biosynthesis
MGIDAAAVVFLFAAKMVSQKGPFSILNAYRELQDLPNKALIMAGEGELRERAEDYVREHSLENVHFVGFVNQSEMPKYYAISDVFVRPDGIYKGDWGLTVNEAMASGLAIIATNAIGATTDLLRHGENGLVVPFNDIHALASAMEAMITNPGLCRSMGARSSEIINQWGYDQSVSGILQALHSLG